jgi:hypothetical protein
MSSSAERKNHLRAIGIGIGLGLGIVGLYFTLRGQRRLVDFVRTSDGAAKLLQERVDSIIALPDDAASGPTHHLPRFPIDGEVARQIFSIDGEIQEFDPQVYFRHVPNSDVPMAWAEHEGGQWTMHTNSLSLREDAEPLEIKPDLRILVAGDSHTEGVCNNSESFPHVLGHELTRAHPDKKIESINAAKGGYSFYNYVGTLEKFLYLKPDVFIVSVYGPNDFEEVLTPYHYFEGTARPPGSTQYWPQVQKAIHICRTWLAQDGLSLKYFQENPGEVEVAMEAAEQATLDIQDICKQNGILLIYVYLPGRFDAEDPRFLADPGHAHLAQELYAALEIHPESLKLHDHMASRLVHFLEQHEIPVVDMRPVFHSHPGPFYWRADHHINVNAHRLIGETLVPAIERANLPGLH